jgi:hypothetical protein
MNSKSSETPALSWSADYARLTCPAAYITPASGFLRVQDLLSEWIHHDRNHVRQMFAYVQS